MVRPKCWRVSARARLARRSSSALFLGVISAENERTVSLFSSGKLSSIGAKATILLSILAAASANFDAQQSKHTISRNPKNQIPGKLQSSKGGKDLTADYAEGSDKKSFSCERLSGSTESRPTNASSRTFHW